MTQQGVKGPGNPWLKFYPSDWRADPSLRMCSIAARGLWIEMLCVMHEADPRGSLRINGKPLSVVQLASLASCPDVEPLLQELEEAGVFSRDETGAIFSRRMKRDAEKAEADKANGAKGGNPRLIEGVNPASQPAVKRADKAQRPEARGHKPEKKTPPSAPQGGRAEELFEILVETFVPSPHSLHDRARSWFVKQPEADQLAMIAAAASFSTRFWGSQRSKGRSESESLSFAPGLHTWLIDGGWKAVADMPPVKAAEPMERLDRFRDEDLWMACERIQGKPAPTSDNSWAFKKSIVDQARDELSQGAAA